MPSKPSAIQQNEAKPNVVIGLLGTTLDAGRAARRWDRWRPTVSLCQHEDFRVDRLELIYGSKWEGLARRIERDIQEVSPETRVVHQVRDLLDPWDFEEVYSALHDFALGYPFDTRNEEYFVHITTGTHVAQICNFLLTEARYFPARLLQTGPSRQRREIAGEYSIIDLDLSKYDHLASRFIREHDDAVSSLKDGIETKNEAFNKLIERVEHVAIRTADPILLTGPTGVGKSRLAGRIYDLRKHRHLVSGPLIEVNCATLRGDAAMSALFGHKKGAFTGASSDRPGLLRSAEGGVLFLDEIGELGADEQAMLLRALEEKRFLPMGSDTEASSDFQLIAGTNRDLNQDVSKGKFREDLFARINLWTFRLPSLRERPEDIEPNLDYELERYAGERGQLVRFSAEGRRTFIKFATSHEATWSSNFRDLNAAMTRMATLSPGGRITADVVNEEIDRLLDSWKPTPDLRNGILLRSVFSDDQIDKIDLFDRAQLEQVIRTCRESKSISEAGRKLFAASRLERKSVNDSDRLRKYLAKHGLDWSRLNSAQ